MTPETHINSIRGRTTRGAATLAAALVLVLTGLFTSAASAVTANDDATSTTEGTPVTHNVVANDDFSDCLGGNGTAPYFDGASPVETAEGSWESVGDGSITFTPAPGFTGIAAITYYVSCPMDGSGITEDSATFTVTVGPEAEIPFTSPAVGAAAATLTALGAGAWFLRRRREGGLA